jgi:hypothetical protein
MSRHWRRTVLLFGGLVLITSPCWAGLGFFAAKRLYIHKFIWTDEDRAYKGEEGLPSDARKWRATLQSYPNFDAVISNPPSHEGYVDYFSKRFPNGEWLFGIEVASHQIFSKGGTVVIRDSLGRTRVFYGHVCSIGNTQYFADNSKDLNDFYTKFQQNSIFREQFLTP